MTWQPYWGHAWGSSPGWHYFQGCGVFLQLPNCLYQPSSLAINPASQQLQPSSSSYSPWGPPPQCYNCGKLGHIVCYCKSPSTQEAFYSSFYSPYATENFNACLLEWYMDSRASSHVTTNYQSLDQLQLGTSGQEICTAGGEIHLIQGSGSAYVQIPPSEIKLTNVKYVPSFHKNLMLIGAVADTSNLVFFSKENCFTLDQKDHVSSPVVIDPYEMVYIASEALPSHS